MRNQISTAFVKQQERWFSLPLPYCVIASHTTTTNNNHIKYCTLVPSLSLLTLTYSFLFFPCFFLPTFADICPSSAKKNRFSIIKMLKTSGLLARSTLRNSGRAAVVSAARLTVNSSQNVALRSRNFEYFTSTKVTFPPSPPNNAARPRFMATASHATNPPDDNSSQSLDFDNPTISYQHKTNWEIARALLVFKICSYPWLVKRSKKILDLSEKLFSATVVGWVLKKTFFAHFCAGETKQEILPIIDNMGKAGIRAILDYAAEADVPQASSTASNSQSPQVTTNIC